MPGRCSRVEILAEAETFVGAVFRHQGRSRETGVDCAGLIEEVGRRFGLVHGHTWTNYPRLPDGETLMRVVRQHADQKEWQVWKPGDFIVLKDMALDWPTHMALLYEYLPAKSGRERVPGLIHAAARQKKVVKHRMPPDWRSKVVGVFEYRGLGD